jgi:hypothetical protein
VQFASRPPGAEVRLDDALVFYASGVEARRRLEPGPHRVVMTAVGRELELAWSAEAGAGLEVRCDFVGGAGCRTLKSAQECGGSQPELPH